MNKKQRQAEQILRHGLKLQRIFPATKDMGPVELCKKLHRIENRMHRLAEDYCNGVIDMDQWEKSSENALFKVNSILGMENVPIFINGDARGYALKIEDQYVRDHSLDIYRDWGGYGILCPEF